MSTKPNNTRVRQSHKKSRKGCRDCKRRHIKCDEGRPACGPCAATHRRCSFLDVDPIRRHSPATVGDPPSIVPPLIYNSGRSTASSPAGLRSVIEGDSVVVNETASPQAGQTSSLVNISHLVLLRHLESQGLGSARLLIPADENDSKRCFETIFNSAVEAPYLMHELLAFSALHLSTLCPDGVEKKKHLEQAAELQTCALSLFNMEKHDVRNDNCVALFLFSSFLGLHTLFDTVACCTDFTGSFDRITSYLKLHRGVGAITSHSWHILRNTDLRYILSPLEAGENLSQALVDTVNDCDKLRRLVENSSDQLGPGPYHACHEAVETLHWIFDFRRKLPHPYPIHITLAWPVRISSEFVELLEQRQPIPLIILAHWAMLLHIDRDFWVFGNAGRHIIEYLTTYLGVYWAEWLDTPKKNILDR